MIYYASDRFNVQAFEYFFAVGGIDQFAGQILAREMHAFVKPISPAVTPRHIVDDTSIGDVGKLLYAIVFAQLMDFE